MTYGFLSLMIAVLIFPGTAEAQSKPSTVPPSIMSALKTAAAKKLRDPYTARFENVTRTTRPNVRGQPTDIVCGYVNAKNLYGAFAGPEPFIYFVADGDFQIARPGDAADAVTMPAMLKTFCAGIL